MDLAAGATVMPPGDVAEWLGRGLQSLVHRFESGRGLRRGRTSGSGPAASHRRCRSAALMKPVGAPVALGTVGGLRPCNTEEDPW